MIKCNGINMSINDALDYGMKIDNIREATQELANLNDELEKENIDLFEKSDEHESLASRYEYNLESWDNNKEINDTLDNINSLLPKCVDDEGNFDTVESYGLLVRLLEKFSKEIIMESK